MKNYLRHLAKQCASILFRILPIEFEIIIKKLIRGEQTLLGLMSKSPTINIQGVTVSLPPYFSNNMLAALSGGSYESPEISLVTKALGSKDKVMDIGAGIGVVSTICCKIIGSENVVAYEANPVLIRNTRTTFKQNRVKPILKNAFVGVKTGIQDFVVHQDFWISSYYGYEGNTRKIRVPVLCLNEEIAKYGPSLVIMDVEGYEYDLVRHSEFRGVQKIVMELHSKHIGQEKSQEVLDRLKRNNFKLIREFGEVKYFER